MISTLLFLGIILALAGPMGRFLVSVFEGRASWMGWLEAPLYRALGVNADDEQDWRAYATSLLAFSAVGALAAYGLLRLQGFLPLNPQGFSGEQMTPHLAFNTAISFLTNTNWQSYSPEQAVSTLSNMLALAMHNWASAAAGMAVAVALVRGLVRNSSSTLGSFWVDMVRGTLYVLLPLTLVASLAFVADGVPQTFDGPRAVQTLEWGEQTILVGPIASQEAIKQLGTNGGGFFNANSAHPYENPSPWSDLLTKLLVFLIPAGLVMMFGRMAGSQRQGWAVLAAMSILFLGGTAVLVMAEGAGNPAFASLGVEAANLEGKDARFGIDASALFASVTTAASNGAVNSMHNSYLPLGGLVPLFNILTGEVIFGGVGAGLYGMALFIILAVFISGLMVGRTPEFLGKKIGRFEVQMAMVAVLVMAFSILGMTAIASVAQIPKEGALAPLNSLGETVYGPMTGNLNNPGARGFTEILYAFASATGNNGSAFAGLTANTPIYNTLLGAAMLLGRFLVMLPVLAIAGHMGLKKRSAATAGTLPTDSPTFSLLLVGVVLIIGALTFFPALALGPVVEHLQMIGGRQP